MNFEHANFKNPHTNSLSFSLSLLFPIILKVFDFIVFINNFTTIRKNAESRCQLTQMLNRGYLQSVINKRSSYNVISQSFFNRIANTGICKSMCIVYLLK